MKGFLFVLLAMMFPWVIFLLEEKPGLAFLAMALQVTIVGWIPMTWLAFKHRENISFFAKNVQKDGA